MPEIGTFDRVVVTGDLLRPFPLSDGRWESASRKNIRWLWSLLAPAMAGAGFPARMLSWDPAMDPREGDIFETPAFYSKLHTPVSLSGWAQLTRADAPIPEDAWSDLLEQLKSALVIVWELPDSMRVALDRAGVRYVNIAVSPLRFLDDLVFALETNVPSLHALLLRRQFNPEEISRQVALIRAKAAWMDKPEQMPPGTALVLGQLDFDRALLCADGGHTHLGHHLGRLHRLCCEHPLVLFKPHPYASASSLSQQAMRHLPAARWTNANLYHLLCQPEIERVVALNSSGLTEAEHFGKTAEWLTAPLYTFGTELGQLVPQDGQWIEPWFWRTALTDAAAPETTPPPAPNRLRRSVNADWGYGFIEKVVA